MKNLFRSITLVAPLMSFHTARQDRMAYQSFQTLNIDINSHVHYFYGKIRNFEGSITLIGTTEWLFYVVNFKLPKGTLITNEREIYCFRQTIHISNIIKCERISQAIKYFRKVTLETQNYNLLLLRCVDPLLMV